MGLSGAANRNIHSSAVFTRGEKVSPQRTPALTLQPICRQLLVSSQASSAGAVPDAFQLGTTAPSV